MEHSPLPEVIYLNHSQYRLSRLRPDQRNSAHSLIAFMRGSSFGTAVLPTPFSEKVEFHPNISTPQSAVVCIGKVRLSIMKEVNRILVSAKGR
jgi:hypothetical protein